MRGIAGSLAVLTFATAGLCAQNTTPRPDADGVYSPGNGVTSPRLVHAVPAVYPSDATPLRSKVGRTLSVVIGRDGSASKIEASGDSSDPFTLAAIAAVRQSKFAPGTLHDSYVPVRVLVWIPMVPKGKPRLPALLPIPYDQMPTYIGAQPPPVQNEPGVPPEQLKYTAVTRVSLIVTDNGLPTDLQVVQSANKDLDQRALEAIQKYRFNPALKYGIPIPAQIMIEVVFHLKQKP